MNAKNQQDDFNIKLMKILNRIEKKMDKEIESSKSRSRMSDDEKIRKTISVERNHHHSPKYSFRKVHSNSIPSPISKHKRRLGWTSYREK
jgi:hypothetical protein